MYTSNNFSDSEILTLAKKFVKESHTLRSLANSCSYSKSTLHLAFTQRLPLLNPSLHKQVNALLQKNWDERHIRGGLATKAKLSDK